MIEHINIEDLVAILFGVFLILTRKWQARAYAKGQKILWGLHLNERTVKIGEVFNVVIGVIFIAFGILGVLGFLNPR